jgi:two-component system response regulator NreC
MRVVLADDHRVFLDSFRVALAQQQACDVVGLATSAREARDLARQIVPDLLVVDLILADSDAVALTRELRRQELKTRILVLSMHDSPAFVRDALAAGAQGYALKDQPLTEVIEGMRVAERGGNYLAPSLGILPPAPARSGADRDVLSRREREIFGLIVQGRSSAEIARSLSISLKTVETHRAHINKKMGVRSPAELIRLAAIQGLLPRGPGHPQDD